MDLTHLKVFISYPRGGHSHSWAETVQRHLETQGAACWRDEVSIAEGDPDAVDRIEQGIETADIVVAVIGTDSKICKWQKRELLAADRLHKAVVALRLDNVTLPLTISEVQPVEERATETETLAALTDAIAHCIRSTSATARTAPTGTTAPSAQRRAEIEYLNRVVYADLADRSASYVPVAGTQRESISLHRVIRSASIPATDVLLREFRVNPQDAPAPRETTYNDVQQAYRELRSRAVRRLAVLGEPGAGKSFSLERFAFEHAQLALADPKQPIPLLVPMGRWTREAESLEDYIARQLNELGRYVGELRSAGRAILLLDGLNEIPSGQRDMKAEQVQRLAMDERYAGVVVSCREKDFQADFKLPFDTLTLQPLSPVRIYEFMHAYLKLLRGPSDGPAIAERRYWELAGGDALHEAWKKWRSAGASFELFWNADEIPRSDPDVYSKTTAAQAAAWEKARFDTRGLIRLAANPYLLAILIALGSTPSNRTRLFEGFLKHLHELSGWHGKNVTAARHR